MLRVGFDASFSRIGVKSFYNIFENKCAVSYYVKRAKYFQMVPFALLKSSLFFFFGEHFSRRPWLEPGDKNGLSTLIWIQHCFFLVSRVRIIYIIDCPFSFKAFVVNGGTNPCRLRF